MALISDEVFKNYVYEPTPPKIIFDSEILTFRLGGLSKSIGMPHFKLSWIIVECPSSNFNQCMERLELISDCYLSVNAPTQLVLEKLLSFAPYFQKQVRNRILKNISILGYSISPLLPRLKLWPSKGGWYGLIEVNSSTTNPKTEKDEKLVVEILNKEKVLVHPGSLYDFSVDKIFLVVSLLPESNIFAEGINRLKNYFMKN
jgi:aspartate/methionine/tyrosine aminotransferase